jgi:hypothetical protein
MRNEMIMHYADKVLASCFCRHLCEYEQILVIVSKRAAATQTYQMWY